MIRSALLRGKSACALAFAIFPLTALAQEALPTIDVGVAQSAQTTPSSGVASAPVEDPRTYRPENASTATKTNTPIMETPISIQVVSPQVIRDQQATNLGRVPENVGGVRVDDPTYNGMGNEQFQIRGFYVTVVYQDGSWDSCRRVIDATGPLNKDGSLAHRLTSEIDHAHSFREFDFSRNYFVSPVVRWDIDAATQAYDHAIVDDPINHKNSDNSQRMSPRGGLLWRPIEQVSVNGSYLENFGEPGGQSGPAGATQILPRQTAQWEVGVKAELFDKRVTATLASYNLIKQNITVPDSDLMRATMGYQLVVGEIHNKDVELDVAGEILPGWSAIGSYAYQESLNKRDSDWRLDKAKLTFQLNVDNLLDTRCYPQSRN